MKMSDELENNTRGKGFAQPKPQKEGLALNPLEPVASNLSHSLAAQVNEFGAIAQGHAGDIKMAAGYISDFLCDAYNGKLLAREVMSQTSEKLRQTAPLKTDSVAAFQPPVMADESAVEQFYTKTSFLRGTTPKQLGQG